MATSALDLILRTKKQGDAEREVTSGLENLKSGVAKLGVVFAGMSATAIAAGVAAKQAFEFGKRGAVVSQTEDSFNRLLISLGANVDLLDELRMASAGTVDDMTLMSSTATLLAGATGQLGQDLANATPELLEIAKAANKLNPTLGDTAFLYESISTGIKRNSPLILDNLGLTIKIGAANEEYAKALGKTVEELTADEQKQALLNEVLRAGNVLIEQAGGAAGGAADAYAELDAALKNYSDRLAKQYSPAITAIVNVMNDVIERGYAQEKAIKLVEEAYARGYITEEKYKEALREAAHGYFQAGTAAGDAAQAVAIHNKRLEEAVVAASQTVTETGFLKNALESDLAPAMEDATVKAEDLAKALEEELNAELQDLKLFISGPLGDEIDKFNIKQGELQTEAGLVAAEIAKLEGKKYLTAAQKTELEELKTKYGEITGAIENNKIEHEIATKSIVFDLLTQRAALDGLTSAEMSILNEVALQWGLVDEATYNAVNSIDATLEGLANGEPIEKAKREIEAIKNAWLGITDKSVTLTVNVGGAGAGTVTGPGANIGNTIQAYADGGQFITNGPQMILVGEAGPEQVTVQPLTTNNYNLTVNEAGGVVDPALSFAFMRSMARST